MGQKLGQWDTKQSNIVFCKHQIAKKLENHTLSSVCYFLFLIFLMTKTSKCATCWLKFDITLVKKSEPNPACLQSFSSVLRTFLLSCCLSHPVVISKQQQVNGLCLLGEKQIHWMDSSFVDKADVFKEMSSGWSLKDTIPPRYLFPCMTEGCAVVNCGGLFVTILNQKSNMFKCIFIFQL